MLQFYLLDVVLKLGDFLWNWKFENVSFTIGTDVIVWAVELIFDSVDAIQRSQGLWLVPFGYLGVRVPNELLPLFDGIRRFMRQQQNEAVATSHVDECFSIPLRIFMLVEQVLDFFFSWLPL